MMLPSLTSPPLVYYIHTAAEVTLSELTSKLSVPPMASILWTRASTLQAFWKALTPVSPFWIYVQSSWQSCYSFNYLEKLCLSGLSQIGACMACPSPAPGLSQMSFLQWGLLWWKLEIYSPPILIPTPPSFMLSSRALATIGLL